MKERIVKTGKIPFKLWLEFEETEPWSDIENDFANIIVNTLDGRLYGINTWTYKFLNSAVKQDEKHDLNLKGLYQVAPDLFVKELSRECIEQTISHLLEQGPLEEVLNPSVFSLEYLDPWIGFHELEDAGETLEKRIKETNKKNHFLYKNNVFYVEAIHQNNNEILIKLEDGRYCVVHFTDNKIKKETKAFTKTEIYLNDKDFWIRRLSNDIKNYK